MGSYHPDLYVEAQKTLNGAATAAANTVISANGVTPDSLSAAFKAFENSLFASIDAMITAYNPVTGAVATVATPEIEAIINNALSPLGTKINAIAAKFGL